MRKVHNGCKHEKETAMPS